MDLIILFILVILFVLCGYDQYYKRNIYQDPLIDRIKYDVCKLDPRIENLEFYSSDESYTEDKQKIFLCLHDDNGKHYDYNMLIYVAIHECSHALTDVFDIEHVTPEFKGMFEHLLRKASEIGIYDETKPLVGHYCGLDLNVSDMQR
jgi:hypothetical protein